MQVNHMHVLGHHPRVHLGVSAMAFVWSRSISGTLEELRPGRPARMADISYTCRMPGAASHKAQPYGIMQLCNKGLGGALDKEGAMWVKCKVLG